MLEDDIATSKYFLKYLNDALNKYAKSKKVCQVSGYSFLRNILKNMVWTNCTLLKGQIVLHGGLGKIDGIYLQMILSLSKELRNRKLISQFNRGNNYNYFKMLLDKSRNKNNSWAICWYAKNFWKISIPYIL